MADLRLVCCFILRFPQKPRPASPKSVLRRSARILTLVCALCSPLLARAQSPPAVTFQFSNGVPQLSITGDVGAPCVVQYATSLSSNSIWLSLTNTTLLGSAFQFSDFGSTNSDARFYRALIPVPTNMVWVSAGNFQMGSPNNEVLRSTNETRHTVNLTKGFFLAKCPLTQGGYMSLVHTNPSFFNTNHGFTLDLTRPVEQVTWFDATNFCSLLTQQDRAAGRILTTWSYRLPTEAEWEYACRGGTTNTFYYGNNLLSGMANFDGVFEYYGGVGTSNNPAGIVLNRTSAVGSYQPNSWGLYDMAGNVWEWCQDWFANYPNGTQTDPAGPVSGSNRVFRGGAFNVPGKNCRSACRNSYAPSTGFNTLGFRVVLSYGP
jgi:formylglycine-generating enzyme required for sulfatase activity